MKVLIFIFACFFLHEISAFSLNQIKGLEGIVQKVRFDSAGNIYAVHYNKSVRYLHKLNPSKEIVWTIVFPSNVTFLSEMHVTNSNDIYFKIEQGNDDYFAILKSNSSTIEIVEEIDFNLFFIDADENLFYSKNSGVQVFKPKSNKSVAIKNLEDFYVAGDNVITADKSGNVYAGLRKNLAFISKGSLTEDVPSATLIKISEESGKTIKSLTIDDRNDLWITLGDISKNKAELKKLSSDGTLKTVAVDDNHAFLELVFAKDKVFVVAPDFGDRTNNSKVFYITLDDNEVVEIPELTNMTIDGLFTEETADSEGNVYIYSFVEISPSLGTMFLIKQNETKPIPIKFNSTESSPDGIAGIQIDYNLDTWMAGEKGLFHLKQGEIIAENVSDYLPDTCKDSFGVLVSTIINYVGKEIYFACLYGGLYVMVRD